MDAPAVRPVVAGRTDGRLGLEEVTDDIINHHTSYIYAPLLSPRSLPIAQVTENLSLTVAISLSPSIL